MFRRWRSPRAEAFLAALLLWGVPAIAAPADRAVAAQALPAQRLVLVVTLDGVATSEPVAVRRQGPLLSMSAADLRALGIAVVGDGEVALATIGGLIAEIDSATQTLRLTRPHHVQQVRLTDPLVAGPAATSVDRGAWGLSVNYDGSITRGGSRTTAAGLIDATVFGPQGYFFAGAIVGATGTGGKRHFARLDTGFTSGDPDTTRRVTLGDLISGATETSRPVRLGGVQVATDFSLRPDLVTFPVPAIDGTAAVPSTLDLIVNGSRRSAGEVRAGQFAVTDVPVQSGVNTVTVAVRDALGRETRQTVSTYVARTLLGRGLTAYSLEAGWVRTGYATTADRYRSLAGSGSFRAGLTDRLTLETHGELAGRVGAATGGASWGLGRFGLLSASVGASVAAKPSQHGGFELAVGYERIGRPVSFAVHYLRHSRGWHDLAADGGAATRAHALAMTVGLELGRVGTLGLTAIDQGAGRIARPFDAGAVAVPVLPPTRFVTATYSIRLANRISLVASGGGDTRIRRSGYVSVGALLVLGRRSSGFAGMLARAGGISANAQWGQVAIEPGDVGYQVAAARGGIDRTAADLSYQAATGYYAAQVDRTNGMTAMRLSARGAVVVGGDGVLLADRLTSGFAVVDTHGQAGVPVYRDNHRVGVTDRRGKLLVANLPAYQPTKIAFDPMAVDGSLVFDEVERWIRPAARSGVPVRFALRPAIGTAVVMLTDADGAPIAAGSRAVGADGVDQPVGLDGMLYLTTLSASNRVVVRLRGGGTCVARFGGAGAGATQARIGPVVCVAEAIADR